MNNQKIIIESLSMDLKRVALGFHRGSYAMVNRFKTEAFNRINELEKQQVDNYAMKLINGIKKALSKTDDQMAEDALMYSTLFQNFALKRM